MKIHNLVGAVALLAAVSCTDVPDKNGGTTRKNDPPARNLSITRANAYNSLFLDSNHVEQFIAQQNVSDTVSESMRYFYNERNFQFAWFDANGLSEQALAFRNLYDYNDTSNARRALDRRLDRLIGDDINQVSASDASIAKTEMLLTWRFINYVWDNYKNDKQRRIALKNLVPAKKQDLIEMAKDELSNDQNDRIVNNSWYASLKKELKRFTKIAENGGWETLPIPKKKIKPGKSDTLVALVKNRLYQSGDFAKRDTSTLFTDDLEKVIRLQQANYGLKADGTINASLVKELNVSVTARIKQLLVNLERMRWMPAAENGSLIVVNIPEYTLHVTNGGDSVFSMPIVVGKQGHNTVMFSGSLSHVVFSPYWNVPPSIVENEIMPAMEKNSDYLVQNNMEITGEEEGLPVIRQLPGDKNELGKVKFLFPNSFNIYFHDTPHKGLFNESKRAFSHGCMRLSQPVRLAKYLLRDQPEWTDERIDSAMNLDKEKWVKVKEPVPVLIYYYTAWVDQAGRMQWREDTYGRDKAMERKLFLNGGAATNELAWVKTK